MLSKQKQFVKLRRMNPTMDLFHVEMVADDTGKRTLPVAATYWGSMMVHLSVSARGWAVSHIATGGCLIASGLTFGQAMECAARVALLPEWDIDSVEEFRKRSKELEAATKVALSEMSDVIKFDGRIFTGRHYAD